eukprot:scaffold22126_cov70-Phaeocystis_antarctica.AAC.2
MKRATSQTQAAQPRASFQWDAAPRWTAIVQAVRFLLMATTRARSQTCMKSDVVFQLLCACPSRRKLPSPLEPSSAA